jgi:hypothetical protein
VKSFTFQVPAQGGGHFQSGEFDSEIGKRICINMPGGPVQWGTMRRATVAPDGRSVELMVDEVSLLPEAPT